MQLRGPTIAKPRGRTEKIRLCEMQRMREPVGVGVVVAGMTIATGSLSSCTSARAPWNGGAPNSQGDKS